MTWSDAATLEAAPTVPVPAPALASDRLAAELGLTEVPARVALRPSAVVMDPERLSVMRPGPLSFVRTLLDRVITERWVIRTVRMDLDDRGHGVAVYAIEPPGSGPFSAVVYSGDRTGNTTDRAYEASWDILVWLFEGEVTPERIAQAAMENEGIVRGQGRGGTDVLSWTRGNRSSRLFTHIAERLAAGRQPDVEEVARVGYLIRNVYYQANGMNGTRMFGSYADEHPLSGAYHVQMLGLYLMRQFSLDLVEHIAARASSSAVRLDPEIRRYIGVGNSTGLGLNLLVFNHPKLTNRWLLQRETVLALLRHGRRPDPACSARLRDLLVRYAAYCREDLTDYVGTVIARDVLAGELEAAAELIDGSRPWASLLDEVAARFGLETEETVITLLAEAHPGVVAPLTAFSSVSEERDVDPGMTVRALRELLHTEYGWALAWDTEDPAAGHWVWYRSMEGEEPRRGIAADAYVPEGNDIVANLPVELQELDRVLAACDGAERVGRLLAREPRRREVVARVQSLAGLPYATVRNELHHRDAPPLHLSRFALSALKGLDKVFVMGDLWVRGVFLQGAPTVDDLRDGPDPDWLYPRKPPKEASCP